MINNAVNDNVHLDDDGFDTSQFFVGTSSIDSVSNGTFSPQNEVETAISQYETSNPRIDSDMVDIIESQDQQKLSQSTTVEINVPPGWIALGTIRLKNLAPHLDQPQWHMFHGQCDEKFPNAAISHAIRRGWMRTEQHIHSSDENIAYVNVLASPEDVNRSVRSSIKDNRKAIRSLLPFLDNSSQAWKGELGEEITLQQFTATTSGEQESLFYIFNTLNSPAPSLDGFNGSRHAETAMIDVLQDEIAGLRTELYPYQRRSVAAMLRREADPAKSLDPRKIEHRDLTGKTFYLDLVEGTLLQHPQLYAEPQGGVLAETMGYGKTLICLALILATRGHYPSLPDGRVDNQVVLPDDKTPSLFTMAARALKYHAVPWKAEFKAMAETGIYHDGLITELDKYEREYSEPVFNPNTPDRKANKRESARILRLCSATLVIVPPNLLVQWRQEITKHTSPGALDLLVIDLSTPIIPHWKELLKYDLILITKARFEAEYRDDDMNQGKRYKGQDKFHSPLTDLRWLRVVCDEGHGFAGSASRTNAMAMLDKMSIERRWVVSGTPSSTLHGVEVDLASADGKSSSRKHSLSSALEGRRKPQGVDQELKDMERLRLIVVNFLKIQPWANQKGSDHADWKKYLVPLDAAGKRRSAPGLRALLQSLIIRHRIEDIDLDLTLPDLYNKTVYLKPSYYDKLAMNMFMLVLTSNAVTSERTDEDYMHHIKNRKRLDELIKNLRQSSFHWVGFTEQMVADTLKVSTNYIDSKIDQITDVDGALLTEAIMNGERALADPGWRAFSTLHEIGVYITEFPEHAASAWAIHGASTMPLLLGTVQAREAQDFVSKHLASGDPTMGLAGAGLRAMHTAKERALEEQNESTKSKTTSATIAAAEEEPKIKLHVSPGRRVSTTSRSTESRKRTLSQSSISTSPTKSSSDAALLPPTKIVGFSSAKLTYLISQVHQYSPSEKIIIFYDTNNIAFWLAEALELVGIKFLIYANTLSVARRATYLATFNATPKFRVLLMDLKQAAHGLHIASASRVYIVSPIWQPNIESQAIKRAHRIGQTRPVYVETLVLEGTIEEKIWKRRKEMTSGELRKAEKSLLDDSTMAKIIQEGRFLKFDEDKVRKVDLDEEGGLLFKNYSRPSSPSPLPPLSATSSSNMNTTTSNTPTNDVSAINTSIILPIRPSPPLPITKSSSEWHKVALLPTPIPLFTLPETPTSVIDDSQLSSSLPPGLLDAAEEGETRTSGTTTPLSSIGLNKRHRHDKTDDLILAIGDVPVSRPESRVLLHQPKEKVVIHQDQ